MAQPHTQPVQAGEIRDLSTVRGRLNTVFLGCAAVGLVTAAVLGFATEGGLKELAFGYLTAYTFLLCITLGALFFVLIQHLTRAGWSASVRRVAELVSNGFGVLLVLFIPIACFVIHSYTKGDQASVVLYRWALPEAYLTAHDHLTHEKHRYLNVPFFLTRIVLYFAIWIWLSRSFLKKSVQQDESGDPALSTSMSKLAAPAALLFALTITFAAFDLIMSLDPHWFSTIFGVYYFVSAFMSANALFLIIFILLQRAGIMNQSATVEHQHDMAKLMIAFCFFWAYVAYSQYMLIWYGAIPEETGWFHRRQAGGLTAAGDPNWGGWAVIGFVLILGKFFIPFLGAMSRHVKRCKPLILFWAVYMLAMQFIDLYWLIVPEMEQAQASIHGSHGQVFTPVTGKTALFALACLVGLGGIYFWDLVRRASGVSLLAIKDPRLPQALAFENL